MKFKMKDPGSAITHLIGCIMAVLAAAPLLLKAAREPDKINIIAMGIFILSMILLYAASTTYHTFDISKKVNTILKKIDHMMISVLIAGSYTPVCLIVLKGKTGIILLSIVWAIAIAGILGPSITNAVIAIGLVSWTKYARMARSLVLKIKHDDYIEAARVTGSKTGHILTHYLLPTVVPTLIITASTDIGGMMLELAGLSFLGFGARPPIPEWGLMLSEGRSYMQNAPWVMIFPGLAILIVVAVFNLLGDSLRDVLDPRDEE